MTRHALTQLLAVLVIAAAVWWFSSYQPFDTATAPSASAEQATDSDFTPSVIYPDYLEPATGSNMQSDTRADSDHRLSADIVLPEPDDAIPLYMVDGRGIDLRSLGTEAYRNLFTDEIMALRASDLPELKTAAAEGDLDAAYLLLRYYSDCYVFPREERELDAALKEITDMIKPDDQALDNVEKSHELLVSRFEDCPEDVRTSQRLAYEYFSQMVRAGHLHASMDFPIWGKSILSHNSFSVRHPEYLIDYRDIALLALNNAITSGHPEAMLKMGLVYMEDILVEQDDRIAYAWIHAASLAYEQQGLAHPGNHPDWFRDELESKLSLDEINSARSDGKAIFRHYQD